MTIVRFIYIKKKAFYNSESQPHDLGQKYSNSYFENCSQNEFWLARYFKHLSQMASICLNVPLHIVLERLTLKNRTESMISIIKIDDLIH